MSKQAERKRQEQIEYGGHERFSPYSIMASYDISPKKGLGQNFLSDLTVVKDIVAASGAGKEDLVIEVGPGLGVMTLELCKAAGRVLAVELDSELIPLLNTICEANPNLRVVEGDILRVNLKQLISETMAEDPSLKRVRVVANLPYYITTPVVMMFLEQYSSMVESLTFMVQKEVAHRLVSPAGGKEYGAISVAVAYYSSAKICFDVGAGCFVPRPKVDSSVVHMEIYKEPPIKPADPDRFFKVVKASFSQRRKMLANSLANASYLGVSKAQVNDAIAQLGLPETVRGETLTPEQFAQLSDLLVPVPADS